MQPHSGEDRKNPPMKARRQSFATPRQRHNDSLLTPTSTIT